MDIRDYNQYKRLPFKVVNDFILFEGPDDEEISVPLEYKVCDTCGGKGKHTNPSIDRNGLSEDHASDPEFMSDYMSGTYDVKCSECNGNRVTPTSTDERFQKMLYSHYEFEAEYASECEAERRMGA